MAYSHISIKIVEIAKGKEKLSDMTWVPEKPESLGKPGFASDEALLMRIPNICAAENSIEAVEKAC